MSWSDEPPEDRIEKATLKQIFRIGRSETIEFFREIPRNESTLAREAVGIGNHKGGIIILGVSEDGSIEGLSNADTTLDKAAEILEDYIEPSLRYTMYIQEFEDEDILIIQIKKYSNLPFTMDRQFFLRKSKKSHPIPPSTVKELILSPISNQDSEESEP